ncbi:hypothetical protein D3C72_1602240 [compost metagenome]
MASKRAKKVYRPRPQGGAKLSTQPWRVSAVFGPLEAVIRQIEQSGTVTTDVQGMPIFKDANDGTWYATCPAIEGIIDAYATHEMRSGRAMPLESLRRFAKKLEYSSPLTEDDCAAVKRDVAALRRETMAMTLDYAASLVRTTQIKIEFDNQERRAA